MTQLAHCHYSEYRLPEKENWLDRLAKPLSETLGMAGYRDDKSFLLTLEHPELLLIPKARFSVVGSLIQRPNPVDFEIVEWSFRFTQDGECILDLEVREIKPSPIGIWFANLSDGQQYAFAGASLVVPAAIILSGVFAITNYPNPLWFWTWFGQHVRGIVGWSLFVLFVMADVWAVYKFRKSPFVQNILLFFFSSAIFLIPFLWLQISMFPEALAGTPEEYIQYLDNLKGRIATFSLLLVGIGSWLALILKWLGLDLFASAVGLLVAEKRKR